MELNTSCCEVVTMPNEIDLGYRPIANGLLGLIDYYSIIFQNKELVKKEGEFRHQRLSLILELIDAIAIPEDLMIELKSAIVAAWRLKVPGSTREKRSTEIRMVLCILEQLRTDINLAKGDSSQLFNSQLSLAALKSTALRPMDFEPRKAQEVQDLLDLSMKYLENAEQRCEVDLATA